MVRRIKSMSVKTPECNCGSRLRRKNNMRPNLLGYAVQKGSAVYRLWPWIGRLDAQFPALSTFAWISAFAPPRRYFLVQQSLAEAASFCRLSSFAVVLRHAELCEPIQFGVVVDALMRRRRRL